MTSIGKAVKEKASGMATVKKGFFFLYLWTKSYKILKNIGTEFINEFKILFDILCGMMMSSVESPTHMNDLLPRLGLLYGLIMQAI